MPVVFRPFLEKLGGQTTASQYIGDQGDLFYDPSTTTLRISDGSTPGGQVVSGGGGGSTGDITFSGIQIIGDQADGFFLGGIQLVPQVSDIDNGFEFFRDGQYINIYPTVGQDAPHIHITAGLLANTSPYYDDQSSPQVLRGDLFIGDDSNYLTIRKDGQFQLYNSDKNVSIETSTQNGLNSVAIFNNGTSYHFLNSGLVMDGGIFQSKRQDNYANEQGEAIIFYSTGAFENGIGSGKLLVQASCDDGDNGQVTELLYFKAPDAANVYLRAVSHLSTEPNNNNLITFTATVNGSGQVEIRGNVDLAHSNSIFQGWTFVTTSTEIQRQFD